MQHFKRCSYSSLATLAFQLGALLLFSLSTQAQQSYSKAYNAETVRVLILLDGSGSMKEEWKGITKFEHARNLLSNVVDSIQKANPKIEVAIRVFGHQSPRTQKNCTDSKLEIPFGNANANQIATKLATLTPQGWTPITYSLKLAAQDIPNDPKATNAIILITDGLETCDGDPCEAGKLLQDKRVSLKPFIIGLGLNIDEGKFFDCVGDYFNVASAIEFKEVLDLVLEKATGKTTAQIDLLDVLDKPTQTGIEISIYDNYSGKLLYNFIHTLNKSYRPDTLYLDPKGRYDIVVHTVPSVKRDNVELIPGEHNVIPIKCPMGKLKVLETQNNGRYQFSTPCIVKQRDKANTLFVQDINREERYLVGSYDVEVLTRPVTIFKKVPVKQDNTTTLRVPAAGTLSILSIQKGIASVYVKKNNVLERIWEYKAIENKLRLDLQPGDYVLIFRPEKIGMKSTDTQILDFNISSKLTTTLRF